jgi:preprotein translocase subunit SecD
MLRWSVAAALVVLATGCSNGTTHTSTFAVYDWEAQRATASEHGARELRCGRQACPQPTAKSVYVVDAPKLTGEDLNRASARADDATGEPTVMLELTLKGKTRFEALMRSLAQRGARVGTPQHMLIVVDDVVYASPFIDFRRNPNGVPAANGLQLSGATTSLAEAEGLAKGLRGEG